MGIIGTKSNNKCTVVTVCKWDAYQATRTTNEQQMNNKRTTNEHVQTQKNIKNIKNTNSDKAKEINDQCEQLYQAYPKKVAKQAAMKAIKKALSSVGFDVLFESVTAYAKSQEGRPDKNYIPAAGPWFNQGRWEDDRITWEEWKSKCGYNHQQNNRTTRQGFHGGITEEEYRAQETGVNEDGSWKF